MAISNQWFGLVDSTLALVATTADDTSTAWAANTAKELTIGKVAGATATTYKVPADASGSLLYYLAICVNAGTVPTLAAQPVTTGISALSPKMGNSGTTNATTPPVTDGTIVYTFAATTGASWPFAYVVGA